MRGTPSQRLIVQSIEGTRVKVSATHREREALETIRDLHPNDDDPNEGMEAFLRRLEEAQDRADASASGVLMLDDADARTLLNIAQTVHNIAQNVVGARDIEEQAEALDREAGDE